MAVIRRRASFRHGIVAWLNVAWNEEPGTVKIMIKLSIALRAFWVVLLELRIFGYYWDSGGLRVFNQHNTFVLVDRGGMA